MRTRIRNVALLLTAVLCLAMAAGCALPEETTAEPPAAVMESADVPVAETATPEPTQTPAPTDNGEAAGEKPNRFLDAQKKEFRLYTLDNAGRVRGYFLKSAEKYMGDALRALGVIDGTEESWGYYVTTVMGMQAAGDGYWTVLDKDGNKMGESIDRLQVADCDEIAFVYTGTEINTVGTPAAKESPTLLIYVQYGEGENDYSELHFVTHETNLGEALRKEGLIEGRQESWGYLVTSVYGVAAEGADYWSIMTFDRAAYQMIGKLETGIDDTAIDYGIGYAFLLNRG